MLDRRRAAGLARATASRRSGRPPPAGSVKVDQIVARYRGLIPASMANSASEASRPAECLAVPETPGGQEIVGVVGPLPLVEVDDPADAVLVAVGVGDDRMRGEGETVGLEDEVVGDPPRRFQVLLHQGRRHGQRFAPSCRSPPRWPGRRGTPGSAGCRRPSGRGSVWSYSALLSRRGGTGPGSPAFRAASPCGPPSIPSTTCRRASAGAAVAPSPGGIDFSSSCSRTGSQCAEVLRHRLRGGIHAAGPGHPSLSFSWHLKQYGQDGDGLANRSSSFDRSGYVPGQRPLSAGTQMPEG